MRKIIILHEKDNVATSIMNIKKGETVSYQSNSSMDETVVVLEDIKLGFKVALQDIEKNEPVIKYGEPIGIAIQHIDKGSLVHLHNLRSNRGKIKVTEGGNIY